MPWFLALGGGLGLLYLLFREEKPSAAAFSPQKTGGLVPVLAPPWKITQRYGGKNNHPGLDIGVPIGTPVFAPDHGMIERVDIDGVGRGQNNGNAIIMSTGGLRFAFLHLSKVAVQAGEQVKPGQIIGWTGNTGHSTGPHLHLQMWVTGIGVTIDPLPWFNV